MIYSVFTGIDKYYPSDIKIKRFTFDFEFFILELQQIQIFINKECIVMLSKKRMVTMFLAAIMAMGAFAGCSDAESNSSSQETESSAEAQSSTETTENSTPDDGSFPLPIVDEPLTLSYWCTLDSNVKASTDNLGNTEYAKEKEKRTGIHIEYIHPAQGEESTSLNLLIASDELPDMVENAFPNGNQLGIDDGVILDLKEGIQTYMPNLMREFEADPVFAKTIVTEKGYWGAVPGKNLPEVTGGLFVRGDWIEELGIEMPETVDEWYTALKRMKEELGVEYPVSIRWSDMKNRDIIRGAFGVSSSFYVDDGVMKFGPMEQGYKEWLTEMNKWYEEGILDPEFMTLTSEIVDTRVTNEQTAMIFGGIGGTLGKYLPILKEKDENATLVGIKPMTVEKGTVAPMDYLTGLKSKEVIISSKNEHVEESLKWLDYDYSEEGHMLKNFGIEGVSYTLVDGEPVYTDLILNNSDGLAIGTVLAQYTKANYGTTGLQDVRYLEQYYPYEEQKEALENFQASDSANHLLSNITFENYTTDEEQELYTEYWSQWATYVEEMTLKFIMGEEPIENFDTSYMEQLKKFQVEKAVEYRQAEYDRYLAAE